MDWIKLNENEEEFLVRQKTIMKFSALGDRREYLYHFIDCYSVARKVLVTSQCVHISVTANFVRAVGKHAVAEGST